jgi:uncharacterized protein YndB with AHSA1/START domain
MHLEAVIVWGEVLGGRDQASLETHLPAEIEFNSEMHLEAEVERVWRCIWRPRSSNSKIHLEAEIKLNSEMHLEAAIERVWRCIWRPRS